MNIYQNIQFFYNSVSSQKDNEPVTSRYSAVFHMIALHFTQKWNSVLPPPLSHNYVLG